MDPIYDAINQVTDTAAAVAPVIEAAVQEPVTYAVAGALVLFALVRRARKQADKGS